MAVKSALSVPLLLLFLSLFNTLTAAYKWPEETFPSLSQIPKDGLTTPGFLVQWELSYVAKSYLPICGLSKEIEGAVYWSNSYECDPAMASFNSTSSITQAAIYDTTGKKLEKGKEKVGEGELRCLCFGIRHVKGRGLDTCVLIGAKGEARERKTRFNGFVAVGLQGPEADERKILPTCEEYEAAEAKAKAAKEAATPKPLLTTEAVIGLAVGLPGAIVAIVTGVIYIRKQRRKRASRYSDVETGAAEKKSWMFWKTTRPATAASPARPAENAA